jgi:hypothetical protein
MSERKDFLFPRLVGKRFDDHSIPLEFFHDLAALGTLIYDLAKWIYRNENDNKRIPKNFFDGISIKVSDIKDGSAIPTIVIEKPLPPESLFPGCCKFSYFEKARDSICTAIRNADNKEKILKFVPDYLLGQFDPIGRNLLTDEYIELISPNNGSPVKYDQEKRKKLIIASSITKEYSEEIKIRGYIPEADQDKKVFTIQQINGPKILAPISEEIWDDIRSAFNNYNNNQIVEITGIGMLSKSGKLQKIETIENVSLLDPLDVRVQLEQIAQLKDGWLDGQGLAPDLDMLSWLSSEFDSNYHPDLHLPYLYPTADGDVQAEWTGNNWEISLEIDLKNKKAEFLAVNVLSREVKEKEIDLNDLSGWSELNKILKELLGASE